MKLGRGRIAVGAGVAVAMTLVAMAVWGGSDGGGHQSPEEIAELATLPEGVTPLDPAAPNPTGGDPSVVGTPPEFAPASSPETFLVRAEQLRDAPAATDASAKAASEEGAGADAEPSPRADDGSLLVSFADGTSRDAMAAALDAAGVEGTPIAGTSVAEVDVTASGGDAAAVSAALEDVDAVESVDPNLIRSIEQVPDDPEYASQAPYLGTVHVPQAWDVADTRSSVTVAVLDTGVDLDHPDLVPNLVAGFDAVNEDSNPSDDQGHGTMVAGIIGASTGNGAGVAGVAWNARIMPVKVLGADGVGTDADLAQGIVWATDHGARVINMSLGGAGASAVIDDAVDYAIAHEVVLVAAAGNDASPVLQYPAAAPGVYGVTATDAAGKFAWFSNHGPWYYLAAPGIGIRSTALAAGATAAYATGSGTSFSSPIVAGVMALVRERHPGWGWFEVGDEVVRTARDSGPAGLDDAYGFGLLDASAALGVSPIAGVSQPVRTGDAGDTQATARAITVGTNATESINYEYDEDWFAFTVPTGTEVAATVTVTPPTASSTDRAAEMDPVVELYGPHGGLAGRMDETFAGEPEVLSLNLGADATRSASPIGRHRPAPARTRCG